MIRTTPTRKLLLLLVSLLAFPGCSIRPSDVSLPPRAAQDGVSQTIPLISGRLLDPQGKPVVGATVRAYSAPYRIAGAAVPSQPPVVARTGDDGSFVLSGPPLGSVAVEASDAAGLKALRTGVAIAQGARIALGTLTLRQTGTVRGRVTIADGGSLLGIDVFIPGTDYLARTDASGRYAFTGVPEGSFALAAMRPRYRPRVLEGLRVAPGAEVEAPLLELSLDAPVLAAVTPDHGGPGSTVRLTGENFGESAQRVLQVTFDDTLAVTVRRISDTVIEAVVPAGSTTGQVVVRADGIASEGRPFRVLQSITMEPPYAGIHVGARQALRAVARDTTGVVVPEAQLDWGVGTANVVSRDADHTHTGLSAGWSEVYARSGTVTGVSAIGVSPYRQVLARSLADPPNGVWVDLAQGSDGSLYLSDWRGSRILRLDERPAALNVVGTGQTGSSPDGTLAAEALLNHPHGIVLDAEGTLFVAENEGHRVLAIPARDTTLFGVPMQAGRLYAIAGTGIKGYNGDGPDARTRQLNNPGDLLLEPDGSLLIADTANGRIRRLTPSGALETLMGGGARLVSTDGLDAASYGEALRVGLARDGAGNVAFSNGPHLLMLCRTPGRYLGRDMASGMVYPVTGQRTTGFNGDGPGLSTMVSNPTGLQFTPQGDLLFCDGGGTLLRTLRTDGQVRTLAGQRYPEGLGILNRTDLLPLPAPASARRFGSNALVLQADGSLLVIPSLTFELHRLEPSP
ncbi:carboxypeptidase regulatory-like domain-containing protein [bacterium]|nr:carboxypeptidase regulatory-like domain-containing protein [bacterium]